MVSVVAITAIALVGVGILAVQANGSAPRVAETQQTAVSQPTAPVTTVPGQQQPAPAADPNALPANSGSGKRIVYSLKASHIWLVDSADKVQRVAEVVPATDAPKPATYKVVTWRTTSKGSDGLSVQYVVLWGPSANPYGFDAVASVQGLPPAPTKTTRGVRMAQEDALAVWTFATSVGTQVVVVP